MAAHGACQAGHLCHQGCGQVSPGQMRSSLCCLLCSCVICKSSGSDSGTFYHELLHLFTMCADAWQGMHWV